MKTNTAEKKTTRTFGGGFGTVHTPLSELKRTIASCLLWEGNFYEDGNSIAERIAGLIPNVNPVEVAQIALMARNDWKLRHVPLFIAVEMLKHKKHKPFVSTLLEEIIQRPDEMSEFLSLYWRNGRVPIAAQAKKGLARAFRKFNEYQLGKWNRDGKVKLKDVLFLCHAKPKDTDQRDLWKRLISGELKTPDTWEVALAGGADKGETFTRLLEEKKLGYMALLMNLRNMLNSGVDEKLISESLVSGALNSRALPFRFISAARAVPDFEEEIGVAMMSSLSRAARLPGRTLLVVDISGSMGNMLSGKSQLSRQDTANALAMLIREISEKVVIYATAGDDHARIHATGKVPPRRAFALGDAINAQNSSLGGGGIFLTQCMDFIDKKEKGKFDRVIVIGDEQDCDDDPARSPSKAKKLGKHNYYINVAPYNMGLSGSEGWYKIDGWSERILDWILVEEKIFQEMN